MNYQENAIRIARGISFAVALSVYIAGPFARADENPGLDEIVVTAQRREENLQKVPISVQTFSEDSAKALGFNSGADLGAFVPGLQVVRGTGVGSTIIRGVGSTNNTPGDEAGNAVYVDGVYISNLSAATLLNLSDIERVEVLKGPQGTLFGRNSTGGLISLTTKTPSFRPSADISVGYGNFDTMEGSFYGTTGITGNLAADLAVFYQNQENGFGHYVMIPGDPDGLKNREFDLRSKWLLNIDEATALTLSMNYSRFKDDNGIYGRNIPGALLKDGLPGPANFYDTNDNFLNRPDERVYGSSVTLKHGFDWANFVSISAFQYHFGLWIQDADRSAANYVAVPENRSTDKVFTQELHLASTDSSKIQWIGGLYGFTDHTDFDNVVTGTVIGTLPFVAVHSIQRSTSFSPFGQATMPILPGTRLTLGYRYTVDNRQLSGVQETAGRVLNTVDKEARFPKATWRASLDHDFTQDILGYISASRGFKSGVFNTSVLSNPAVQPETLNAYEIGLKVQAFDNRVRFNNSVFLYNYDNMQVKTNVPGASIIINAAKSRIKGFESEIDIVPLKNLTIGSELSVLDGKFLSFPGMPIATPAPCPPCGNVVAAGNGAGNYMPQIPKFTVTNSVQYLVPLESGNYSVNVHFYHNNGFFWDGSNRLRENSYSLVNSTVQWVSPDDRYTVRLFGKNLLDKKYWTYESGESGTGDYGIPAPPRTYGVNFEVKFR